MAPHATHDQARARGEGGLPVLSQRSRRRRASPSPWARFPGKVLFGRDGNHGWGRGQVRQGGGIPPWCRCVREKIRLGLLVSGDGRRRRCPQRVSSRACHALAGRITAAGAGAGRYRVLFVTVCGRKYTQSWASTPPGYKGEAPGPARLAPAVASSPPVTRPPAAPEAARITRPGGMRRPASPE